VVAACFSGGFAELAFEDADKTRGASSAPRCGLFAGTWDRQTSGCDPDPDRRSQEGYSLHVLQALAGKDRDGKSLPKEQLDYDGDGAIGWLDAHTRARIASTSVDVPTTTSERFLRRIEPGSGPLDAKLLPEEGAVIAALTARLHLEDEAAARARLDDLGGELEELDEELSHAEDALDSAAGDLSARLLEHWPILDDAYHPGFTAALQKDSVAIARWLDDGPLATAYREAERHASALQDRYFDREVDESMVERLVRAYETLHKVSALSHRGGPDWARYQAFLACERGHPE
jgi:hypothetical protein